MSLTLGVLATDSVRAEWQGEFGDYPQMFEAVFRRVDPALAFVHYDVQRALPADTACDAYIITGSKHSVYEDLPWIHNLVGYLQRVFDAGKKVIGVCFGHQLIAHYFGGETQAAQVGWGVGVQKNTVVQQPPWMRQPVNEVRLICSHKDQVVKAPPGAQVFASSAFCPIAGFTLGERAITIQGHPEFNKTYSQTLLDFRRDAIGEAVYTAGVNSLCEPTDEDLVTEWLLDFVGHGQPDAHPGSDSSS